MIPSIRGISNNQCSLRQIKKKRISPNLSRSKLPRNFNWNEVEFYRPPPEDPFKKTLILDLDETLVHSSDVPSNSNVEFFEIEFSSMNVLKRPGLNIFLDFATANFDVFVFTFSESFHADPILDKILPKLDQNHRLYRDSCLLKHGSIYKDIEMFQRKFEKIIFVDDNLDTSLFYPQNSIHVTRWEGNPDDKVFVDFLQPILEKCIRADDIRKVISDVNQQT